MKLKQITPWAVMLTSITWAGIGLSADFSQSASEIGTVTDNNDDGFETVTTGDMRVRRFDGTVRDRGVATFDVSAVEDAVVLSASLSLNITTSNNPGTIDIVLFNGDTLVDVGDATAAGESGGNLDPEALGAGTHDIALDPTVVGNLLLSGLPITARLQSADNGVNTELDSATLNIAFEPATTFNATDDATLTDANGDGIFASITNGTADNDVFKGTILGDEDRTIISFETSAVNPGLLLGALVDITIVDVDGNSENISVVGFAGDGSLGTGDATRAGVVLGEFSPAGLGVGTHSISLDLDGMRSLLDGNTSVELRFDPVAAGTNAEIGAIESGLGAELMLDVYDGAEPTQTIRSFNIFRSTFVRWNWDSTADAVDLYLDGLFFETNGSGNRNMRISREPHTFQVCVSNTEICSDVIDIEG